MRSYADMKRLVDLSERSVHWLNKELTRVETAISALIDKKKRTKKQEKELESLFSSYKSLLNKTQFEMSIIDKLIQEIDENGQEE